MLVLVQVELQPNVAKIIASLQRVGLQPKWLVSNVDGAGFALIIGADERLGLLRWGTAVEPDPAMLAKQIQWGRAGVLLPIAEQAEREILGAVDNKPPSISGELREMYRSVS